MGGTVSTQATDLARELWMWCPECQIHLTVQLLPRKDDVKANTELTQMNSHSYWVLDPEIFQRTIERFPFVAVDLFVTRLASQLPHFYSWRLDPLAKAMDAFLKYWRVIKGYANPPWNVVGGSTGKSGGTGSRPYPSSANMAVTTMVPQTLQTPAGCFSGH